MKKALSRDEMNRVGMQQRERGFRDMRAGGRGGFGGGGWGGRGVFC